VGQGLPLIDVSRSGSDTPHSVGLLLTSYQSPYNTQNSPETHIRVTDMVRTRSPNKRAAIYPHSEQALLKEQ